MTQPAYFDPKQALLEKIRQRGGWVNAHSHIDRAYILTEENFHLSNSSLQQKWALPDEFKAKASVDDIYSNMARAIETMCAQGVQALGSFIDVDPVIQDKAIKAAQKARDNFKGDIQIKFINQVVKGVLDPEARKWFEVGAEFVDIIGGLPEKDQGHEAEHLDILFETAKKNGGKPLHAHIDQYGLPSQRDTELLTKKTVEHGYQGKVVAVHGISIGAQPLEYRTKLYEQMKAAEVMVVCCPLAYIASHRSEDLAPLHNMITPVEEMLSAGLTVGMGCDNIHDMYMPFADGDMWSEMRVLLEACYIRDLDVLADIATVNGLKTLFL
ncbi:MAG TPA: amidohydrolase family protein [Candidatus Dormibacteraeota bacterium]|nr:amidohydrolase family protein [Candidatus Dormibacteraeota bacterium]